MTWNLDFATLPQRNSRSVSIRVNRRGENDLRRGYPWVHEAGVIRQSHNGAPGDLGVVFDSRKKVAGIGLYDPLGPLRLRVLAHQGTPIDERFFHQRVGEAAQKRAPLLKQHTDGYRVIHGENDGLGGLIVDRYGDTVVVKLYTSAWVPHLKAVLEGLANALPYSRCVLRLNRSIQESPEHLAGLYDGQVLRGEPPEGAVIFRENGLRFEAEPIVGQKTGFFLDQRDNRARVEAISEGKRILNVFAYNGGFSLYAARGGAKEVTSVDISAWSMAACARHFDLNADVPSIARCPHREITGDAFKVMEELARKGERWDVVIIDPPAFARRRSQVPGALRAYGRLARVGAKLTSPGGHLVLASCSRPVDAPMFFDNARSSIGQTGRALVDSEETSHGVDHPVTFEGGAYLKCLWARLR